MNNDQMHEQLLDEAAAWVARLRSDRVSADDKQRFSAWLNRSQAHQRAFDNVADLWQELHATRLLPGAMQARPTRARAGNTSFFSQHQWFTGVAVACASLLVAVLLAWQPALNSEQRQPDAVYMSKAGEQRRVELADGSVIELNTRSTVAVHYSDDVRQLTLLQGEAYFEVAPNKQRPFVVDVGRGTVTAVGTAFNIYRQANSATVTVTEGTVRVQEDADLATPTPNHEQVTVNQRILLDRYGLSAVGPASDHAVTWRQQTVVFNRTPLPEAIAEIGRYLDTPLIATDPELASLLVSGTFSLNNPAATLQALAASFQLSQQSSAEGIEIRKL